MSVEQGPEPASPLPWTTTDTHEPVPLWDDLGEPVGTLTQGDAVIGEANAAAIVHRVNNWDALIAERDDAEAKLVAVQSRLGGALLLLDENREKLLAHYQKGSQ